MRNTARVILAAICIATACMGPAYSSEALDSVQIHGFASQGYLYTDDNDFLANTTPGTFEYNEIGINFTVEPIEKLRIGVQLFSRDLGEFDNNRVDLDWAFADYRWRDELGIRLGRFKVPRGLMLETMDLDMTRTSVFLPFSCYEIRYRAAMFTTNGINLYGNLRIGPLGSLDYSGVLGTSIFPKEALESQYEGLMEVEKNSERLFYGGRLIWNTPLKGFMLGGSYFIAEDFMAEGKLTNVFTSPIGPLGSIYPSGTKLTLNIKRSETWNAFLQLNYKKFTFTSEYNQSLPQYKASTSNPYDPFVASLIGFKGLLIENTRSAGWYAQADYQFLNWLTAAVTYGEYYMDIRDLEGKIFDPNSLGYQKDTTLSLRFDINSNWNVKLETHFIDGTALVVNAQRTLLPEDLEQNWMLFAAKTSFYF